MNYLDVGFGKFSVLELFYYIKEYNLWWYILDADCDLKRRSMRKKKAI